MARIFPQMTLWLFSSSVSSDCFQEKPEEKPESEPQPAHEHEEVKVVEEKPAEKVAEPQAAAPSTETPA